jgi:hypothetical protein
VPGVIFTSSSRQRSWKDRLLVLGLLLGVVIAITAIVLARAT